MRAFILTATGDASRSRARCRAAESAVHAANLAAAAAVSLLLLTPLPDDTPPTTSAPANDDDARAVGCSAAGGKLSKSATAPAITGEATEVPESTRQPLSPSLPST